MGNTTKRVRGGTIMAFDSSEKGKAHRDQVLPLMEAPFDTTKVTLSPKTGFGEHTDSKTTRQAIARAKHFAGARQVKEAGAVYNS